MSILCVGQIVADVVVRPVDGLPVAGRAYPVTDLSLVPGGCTTNTACVLAKLGLETSLSGMVGTDSMGDAILVDIKSCGVDTTSVVRNPEVPTTSAIVAISSDGERSFLYRPGGCAKMGNESIDESIIKKADLFHIGGVLKMISLDLPALFAKAKACGCKTSMDTDWDTNGGWYSTIKDTLPHVDYLLTNEEEGEMLSGCKGPVEIANWLLDKGPQIVVIKRGENGSVAVTKDGQVVEYPAYKVPVMDTTCAGDSFVAGFIYGMSSGWDLKKTMLFANATGALCTTKLSHVAIDSFAGTMEFIKEQLSGKPEYQLFV